MSHSKGIIRCSCANVFYPVQAIQWSKCKLTRFSTYFRFEFFSECIRGALKTLWRAICSPRACSWTTLAESNHAYAVFFLHTAWLVIYASLSKYT